MHRAEVSMATGAEGITEREARLDQVIAEFLQASSAEQGANQAEWLARYPDLASDLQAFFADRACVATWTDPIRQMAGVVRSALQDPHETIALDSRTAQPVGL